MYNILDKDLTVDYIKAPKFCTIFFALVDLILVVIALFSINKSFWVLPIVFFIPFIIMTVYYFLARKTYGFKFKIENQSLKIYNYSGKYLRELDLSTIKIIKRIIKFYAYRYNQHSIYCLVLYNNIDKNNDNIANAKNDLLFNSLIKDPNVFIVQNPEAISYIENILKIYPDIVTKEVATIANGMPKLEFYNIFDSEIYNKTIKSYHNTFMILTLMNLCTLVMSFKFIYVAILYSVLIPTAIILIIEYLKHKRKYGIKININNSNINVYDYKGKLKNKLSLLDIQSTKKIILLYPKSLYTVTERLCLILFNNIDDNKIKEYKHYWNDPNVLIVQNPETIAYIEQYLNISR